MTLILALLLDAALGEPRWIWGRVAHPIQIVGRAIEWADERFNNGENRQRNGILLCVALCAVAGAAGFAIAALPFGLVWELLIVAILIAHRSLVDHVRTVSDALRLSLGDGRLAVAAIVGRDTAAMDRPAVARAAIESAAENFSDGLVAPIFWYVIAGLPGILIFKAVNTADSTIGYRTPRHAEFGWASARLDDALNWIPARLTALLFILTRGTWRRAGAMARDARSHRSPNAGWPEAAMAVCLNVALAGPRAYGGEMQEFPFVHPEGRRDAGSEDIDEAIRVLWRTWSVLLALAVLATPF